MTDPSTRPPCSRKIMNSSIRLFRSRAALNTSRRILTKSITQSNVCVNSLKNNNANLAKRVAELQQELSQQRTAAQEAVYESTRLQHEVSRLRTLLEVRSRLNDGLLQLREEMNPVIESVMNMMSILNRLGQLVNQDQDPSETASFLVLHDNLVMGLSQLANQTLLRSPLSTSLKRHQELPSEITYAPTTITTTGVNGARQSQLPQEDPPCISPIERRKKDSRTVISRQPSPPPSTETRDFLTVRQQPSAVISPLSTSPVFSSALPMQLAYSPNSSLVSLFDDPVQTVPLSDVRVNTAAQPDRPTTTQSRPLASQGQQPDINVAPSAPPVQQDHQFCLPTAPAMRRNVKRRTRVDAKPIIDVESSQLSFLDHEPPPPPRSRTKKRSRVVCGDNECSDEDYTPRASASQHSKRKTATSRKTVVVNVESPDLGANVEHPTARIVEGGFNKTGQLVFRTDAKLGPQTVVGSKSSRSKSRKKTGTAHRRVANVDAHGSQPNAIKSVFDLSANLTINTSTVPASLNELRQKNQQQHDSTQIYTEQFHRQPIQPTSSGSIGDEVIARGRPSVVLSPIDLQKLSVNINSPSPPTNDRQETKRRFNRLLLSSDSENEDPSVKTQDTASKVPADNDKRPRKAHRSRRRYFR